MSVMKTEPYATYKDSSVFGRIPASWDENALKRFCIRITDGAHTSPDLDENGKPFLSVVDLRNGELDFSLCKYTSLEDYESLVRNGCRPYKGDLLYSKDGTISETVVVKEDREFVVGSSFIIIRFNRKSKADYYFYLLSSQVMKEQARMFVRGAGLPRISIFNVAKLNVINPSFYEQTAIATYLDTKTAQIDRKIDLLGQKATQYSKLMQSLVYETITRGLDKSVSMEDSGVEWIGEVPKHWEVVRLKDISIIEKGEEFDFEGEEGVVPYLNGGMKPSGYSTRSNVSSGVIAVSEGGASSGYTQFMNVPFWCGAHCYAIFPKTKCAKYLFYCIKGLEHVLVELKTGSAMPNLKKSEISNFLIPISKNQQEQAAIAAYLDEKTKLLDNIIDVINNQIANLRDLRKGLINDVVTGKMKVVSEGLAT